MTEQSDERIVPQSALFANHIKFWVILADESHYEGQAYLNNVVPSLTVQISNKNEVSLSEIFSVFSDPEKTRVIKSQTVDTQEPAVFEGYTTITGIRQDYNGNIFVSLIQ